MRRRPYLSSLPCPGSCPAAPAGPLWQRSSCAFCHRSVVEPCRGCWTRRCIAGSSGPSRGAVAGRSWETCLGSSLQDWGTPLKGRSTGKTQNGGSVVGFTGSIDQRQGTKKHIAHKKLCFYFHNLKTRLHTQTPQPIFSEYIQLMYVPDLQDVRVLLLYYWVIKISIYVGK